jgi:hypothetical protein
MTEITNITIYDDVKTLVPLLLSNYIQQVNGGNHYSIEYQGREKCPQGMKPVVYWNSLQFMPFGIESSDEYRVQISFDLGLKNNPNSAAQKNFGLQGSMLMEMFNPYTYGNWTYSFTFKNTVFTNVTMPELGIIDPLPGGAIENELTECRAYYYEFPVTFFLKFDTKFNIPRAYKS